MQLKQITAVAVLLLMVASLLVSGCTTTQNTAQNAAQGTMSVKVTQVPAPATIGSPYVYAPKHGYKFVMFNTTVTNINANSRNVHTLFFTLHDSNNNAYSVSQATNDKSIAGFPNNVVTQPGDKVNGLLVFEVPQNATLKSLTYNDGLTEIVTNL
jgi:hypothetical protein